VKVAEAAKVIENTQRDINISLMNELAIIFDRMGIDTREVIEAAGTKWNFHKYYPGLVGGHCISVDPFYLMHKARELGYEPQVIAAGRRVNDYMPHFIVKKVVQALIENGKNPGECRVLVMGITFKEDVADIRNSKVVDLVRELEDYSITVDVIDPHASIEEVRHKYDIELKREPEGKYDAVVVAVGHKEFLNYEHKLQLHNLNPKWIVFDIKGIFTGSGANAFKRL
jgi:UDP-N-acetyl-D-galactosamine dehydrogenase